MRGRAFPDRGVGNISGEDAPTFSRKIFGASKFKDTFRTLWW
jgi:hypothetical protein